MKLLKKNFGYKNTVCALGAFDGIHIGHKKIIRETIKIAHKLQAKSIILTFEPHPKKALAKNNFPLLLTPYYKKIDLIKNLSPDLVLSVDFNTSFANMSAQHFIEFILVKKLNIRAIVIGPNFRFGKERIGNIQLLKKFGKLHDFKVVIVQPAKINGQIISSTVIRKLITTGKLEKANIFLGRKYSIIGNVIKGIGRGRKLGFPTANVSIHHEILPPCGVYAVQVIFKNNLYNGICNIGFNPTFIKKKPENPIVEVHIINKVFSKPLYGKILEIIFIKKLRNEKTFANVSDLTKQIAKDKTSALKYLV
ncbi:MAG: bifunctional riboflavin kinase/FAD synthetase [Candidatus Firestonebacteria bacterium]